MVKMFIILIQYICWLAILIDCQVNLEKQNGKLYLIIEGAIILSWQQQLKVQQQVMRRPKLKSFATSFITIGQQHQMTPWNTEEQMNLKQNNEQIPTYRRQIMQKFFGNVHFQNKQTQKFISKRVSPERKQERKKSINLHSFQQLQRISKTQQSLDNSSQSNSYEQIKIKRNLQRKKKTVKATIINFNADFVQDQERIIKQKTIKDASSNKSFARKLRLKQTMNRKKNIEPSLKDYWLKTPTSKANPYYVYHYNKSLKSKEIRGETLYCRASSLRKRPTSEQIIRPHEVYS